MSFIPYGRQDVTDADVSAVAEVLRSDWLTQGPLVPKFERSIASYCGAAYAVGVNSATSALHVACLALGVGKEDWVWTSPVSFVASANCALYCGGRVDFVDIDAETFNLSVEALAAKLKVAEASRRLPKVLIVVHFGGQSCAMESIAKLSRTYGFRIIEDASHAIGARYRGRAVGCCEFSDITVFSFHPVKIITTAEGGAAVTNDPALAETMERLRSHGITRDPGKFTNTAEGPWYYEQTALGFNYRLNDLQAALGLSQITRLDMYVRRRQELAHRYKDALRDLPVMPQQMRAECYSAYHLYSVRLRSDGGAPQRLRVFGHLRAAGVGVNVHYMPIHLQPYYRTLGFRTGDFPAAESYYAEALTLPLYPGLTEAQQDRVVALLKEAVD